MGNKRLPINKGLMNTKNIRKLFSERVNKSLGQKRNYACAEYIV